MDEDVLHTMRTMLHDAGAIIPYEKDDVTQECAFRCNLARLCTGNDLLTLAGVYIDPIVDLFTTSDGELAFDIVYATLHCGSYIIPALAVLWELAEAPGMITFCTSRSEIGARIDGGVLVGAAIKPGDRVLILTDVTTNGLLEEHAINVIYGFRADPVGLITCIDMQCVGISGRSIMQEIIEKHTLRAHALMLAEDVLYTHV